VRPSDGELDRLAAMIDRAEAVTMFCGAGCAGAKAEVIALADRIAAPIVHTLRGKEWVEADNPFDVGMTGLIGFASGYHAMERADLILMLGADFPYQQFFPQGVPVAQVDLAPAHLGRRCPLALGLVGDVRATIEALLPRLGRTSDRDHLEQALDDFQVTRADLDDHARGCAGRTPIHPEYLTAEIGAAAADDAIFTADVGEPVVWAARYLRMRPRQRLIGSFTHGSMAAALPLAIGAQMAFPGRQVVALAGDGGFAMLMGEWLTLLQHRLPVKLVVYDNSSLGFVEVEMKAAGLLDHGTGLTNPDFARMAEATGALGLRVEDPADVRAAVEQALAHPGPVLVDVVTNRYELPMPPKTSFGQAKDFGLYTLKAVLSGRGRDLVELVRTNRA
jgi:pyruvate dehydrogenase (quinone)